MTHPLDYIHYEPSFRHVPVGILIGLVLCGVLLGPVGLVAAVKAVVVAKKAGGMLKALWGAVKAVGNLTARVALGGGVGFAAGSFSLNPASLHPGGGGTEADTIQVQATDRQLRVDVAMRGADSVSIIASRGGGEEKNLLVPIEDLRGDPVRMLTYVADLRAGHREAVRIRFDPDAPASLREWVTLEFVDQGFQPVMEWME